MTSLTLRVLKDREMNKNTKVTSQNLTNMYGNQYNIPARGLESMTEGDHVPEVAKLKSLFQELCEEEIKTFSRTHGKIDIILDISSRSVFAPGWVLTGRAPARGRREFSVLVEAHSMAIEGSTTRPKENSAKK